MKRKTTEIDTRVYLLICTIVLFIAWLINKYFVKNNVKYSTESVSKKLSYDGDSKGEIICREHLESKFKAAFPKVRPNFLKNPKTGRNLELDCYNSDLGIAVEYNGAYHYNSNHYMFDESVAYRDALKKQLCEENGVFLISVPYTVKFEDIPKFIDDKLKLYYKTVF